MRDPDGRSRGFAFLTFEDPESVNAVTGKEHVLDGKAVSVSTLLLLIPLMKLIDRPKTRNSTRRAPKKYSVLRWWARTHHHRRLDARIFLAVWEGR